MQKLELKEKEISCFENAIRQIYEFAGTILIEHDDYQKASSEELVALVNKFMTVCYNFLFNRNVLIFYVIYL